MYGLSWRMNRTFDRAAPVRDAFYEFDHWLPQSLAQLYEDIAFRENYEARLCFNKT